MFGAQKRGVVDEEGDRRIMGRGRVVVRSTCPYRSNVRRSVVVSTSISPTAVFNVDVDADVDAHRLRAVHDAPRNGRARANDIRVMLNGASDYES